MTIGERIRNFREHLGLDQVTFAASIGVSSRDTISRWERGLAFPSADTLLALHEKYGINTQWLITGEGGMSSLNPPKASTPTPEQCLSPEDFVILPMLESKVAAGPEGEVLYEEIRDYYPFKRWWIESSFGRSEERIKSLVLLKVRGDSMCPTINQGELILVDTFESERVEIRTGAIYLVTMPDGSSAIKRLALSESAGRFKLICISDNVAVYRPYEFPLDPDKSIKHYVLGRVRWAGKEFD